jgi:hypothetical protein
MGSTYETDSKTIKHTAAVTTWLNPEGVEEEVDLGVLAGTGVSQRQARKTRIAAYKAHPEWAAHQRKLALRFIAEARGWRAKWRVRYQQRLVLRYCPKT